MEGNRAYSVIIAREMGIPLIDVIGFMAFLVKAKPGEGVDIIKLPIEGPTTPGQNPQHQRDKPTSLSHNLQCYPG